MLPVCVCVLSTGLPKVETRTSRTQIISTGWRFLRAICYCFFFCTEKPHLVTGAQRDTDNYTVDGQREQNVLALRADEFYFYFFVFLERGQG